MRNVYFVELVISCFMVFFIRIKKTLADPRSFANFRLRVACCDVTKSAIYILKKSYEFQLFQTILN